MLIIFGIRRLKKGMGQIRLRCANCGMSPQALLRVSTWFALFFIPVIPLSFKHYTVCPNCKRLSQIEKSQVEAAQAMAAAGDTPTPVAPGQPATLEHAVNQWASVGYGSPSDSSPSGTGTPDAPPGPFTSAAPPTPPAGWFPDPAGSGTQRYWDGRQWTEHTAPQA